MKKAATDSRSNLPEFTDMVSLFDATISQCLIPQLIAIATRILKNLSFIMKAHRVSESYSITNKYNFHLTWIGQQQHRCDCGRSHRAFPYGARRPLLRLALGLRGWRGHVRGGDDWRCPARARDAGAAQRRPLRRRLGQRETPRQRPFLQHCIRQRFWGDLDQRGALSLVVGSIITFILRSDIIVKWFVKI
jgi:hypothetical protein